MPISSLIIKTKPERAQAVVSHINTIQQAEIVEIQQPNIVVITDTTQRSEDKDLWKQIEAIPGVISCDLIYHNFEDEEGFPNV